MGHHRDDQVENRLMRGYGMAKVSRLSAGENLDGPDEEERWIVRPLLEFDKVSNSLFNARFLKTPIDFFIFPS